MKVNSCEIRICSISEEFVSCDFVACLGMEGCCAVEREVDRVLAKFNTTQQVVGMIKIMMKVEVVSQ